MAGRSLSLYVTGRLAGQYAQFDIVSSGLCWIEINLLISCQNVLVMWFPLPIVALDGV